MEALNVDARRKIIAHFYSEHREREKSSPLTTLSYIISENQPYIESVNVWMIVNK